MHIPTTAEDHNKKGSGHLNTSKQRKAELLGVIFVFPE